ncbi:hypothetical protein AGMMS49579_25430 [Spirochaetia bacterium]|nr:hypothetical protein AGMMS49579_25430 [Spirochaetia bacterium]
MADNRHLVPTCIIYIDGNRLNQAHEGALRSVKVFDKLNGISECVISFDSSEQKLQNDNLTGFESLISIHLGYKDDMNEVFSGEITGRTIVLPEFGTEHFIVTGSSTLHRLGHALHSRVFERKSPSEAIQRLVSFYDLQGEIDAFGRTIDYWEGGERTDLDLVLSLVRQHGRDIYTCTA